MEGPVRCGLCRVVASAYDRADRGADSPHAIAPTGPYPQTGSHSDTSSTKLREQARRVWTGHMLPTFQQTMRNSELKELGDGSDLLELVSDE